MGHIYDDFARELAEWQRRYEGRPRAEMMRLFFLALEREQIVAVGYRESLMERRLQAMPIEPAVRELIRHAMLWAWKDEEMHAIYIRGAIFQLGNWFRRGRAFAEQLAGAVGGWASSVQHHVPWSQAPLSRSLAAVLTGAGSLVGRVPAEVRKQLQYGPFRNFCLFNVDAEKTAWLCWQRLADLAGGQPDLAATVGVDFARIRDDEARHQRLFEILADSLDAQDRLVAGATADTLADQIAAVGRFFLPRARRGLDDLAHPLGGGGRVWVYQGQSAADKRPLFRRLLMESGLGERLEARARTLGKSPAELRIAIKPTFMMGYHRKDLSCVTDPELIEELALFLHAHGCRDMAVVEARNLYDRFFQNRAVNAVAQYFHLHSPLYRIVDVSREQVGYTFARGLAQYTVGRTWKEADFRISFGKMCSQPVDLVHLTVKNLEGLGTRCEEFLFVERRAHRQTALMMLLDDFPPHFALLDAYDTAADGMLGMMGCPRPRSPHRIYAAADALALDRVAARHMGLKDVHASTILRAACHWFGDPAGRIEVIGINEPLAGWRGPYANEFRTLLSILAYPVYQFGSGRGSLFVPEMDDKAFPPAGRVGPLLRLGRRALQMFLGLKHPSRARDQSLHGPDVGPVPTVIPRRSDRGASRY